MPGSSRMARKLSVEVSSAFSLHKHVTAPLPPSCVLYTLSVDCSAVLCLRPICGFGEELVVPPRQCCPVCQCMYIHLDYHSMAQCVASYTVMLAMHC